MSQMMNFQIVTTKATTENIYGSPNYQDRKIQEEGGGGVSQLMDTVVTEKKKSSVWISQMHNDHQNINKSIDHAEILLCLNRMHNFIAFALFNAKK